MRFVSKWLKRVRYLLTEKRSFVERLLMIGGFILVLSVMSVWNVLASDQTFSEQENRVLTQKPPLSVKGVLSGKFMSDYEAYLSDQFVGKIGWTTIKAKMEQWQGKREINDIFIDKDEFLLERFTDERARFQQNLTYIKEFATKDSARHVSFMLVPTSIEFYEDKLPLFAEVPSQKPALEEAVEILKDDVNVIDVYSTLATHKHDAIYFKTDHHWTMKGAYYAYAQAAEALDFKPNALTDFSTKEVSTTFLGTYASKVVGFPVQPDTIEIFQPKFPHHYIVTYHDTNEVVDSLFHPEFLQKRDQYAYFLNGNHSLLTIETHVENGRKLAVIKDSYAHVLIPFLANHYEEIHVIDLRYYHAGLEAYLEENHLNDILLMYNVPNFITDSNLIWLKS